MRLSSNVSVSEPYEPPSSKRLNKLKRQARVELRSARSNRRKKAKVPLSHSNTQVKTLLEHLDRHKVIAALVRSSFYDFVKVFWHEIVAEPLVDNWHIEYICNEMQKCAERVFKGEEKLYDQVFNVPPGSSKSTICSIMFPAWVWTRMPAARCICCSYAEKLAMTFSRKCRQVIKSELYAKCFPEIEFRSDQDTKGMFANTKGGERYAVGSGGFVMGNHAHFIIIDDPVDPDAVLSETELERINNWIKEQLSGRKVDKSVSVTFLIMQRLHQDDPTARMLKQSEVKHVKLPATDEFEVKPASLRKYYKDGLMDPIRLKRKNLNAIREGERGEYVYAGQYGQEPVPPGGGMFKIKRIVKLDPSTPLPKMKALVRYWDKAASDQTGAYSVGVLMGISAPPKDEHLFRQGKRRDGLRQTPIPFGKKAERAIEGKSVTESGKTPRHKSHDLFSTNYSTNEANNALSAPHKSALEKRVSAADHSASKQNRVSASRFTRHGVQSGKSRLFVLDVIRVQLDSYQRERLIRQTAKMDGKHVIVGLEQEGAGGGKESAENTVAGLMGYKVRVLRPVGKKEARAEPFSVQVNAGNVYVMHEAWTDEYLSELKHFPFSTFKDQVDASAGAFTCLLKGSRQVGGMKRSAS